jgi:lipopolysaccharide export system protein LptA
VRRCLLVWTAGLACAAPAAAQAPEGCALQVVTAPGTRSHYTQMTDGTARLEVGGGVEARCGPTWMRADSASYAQGPEILWLFGRVEIRDTVRTLHADRVTWYAKEERMRAEGRVRVVARTTGSTLDGSVLDYWPATERRAEERMLAPNRPHLTLRPDPDAAERRPLEVDGDRVHVYGERRVAVAGRATAVREGLAARADSIHLALDRDEIWMFGDPAVVVEGTTLAGDTIRAELRERRVERVEAWPRGRARSQDYALRADSIDVRLPGQQLREVVAVGNAVAEAYTALAARDETSPADWVAGDTIVATFEPAATAPDAAASADAAAGDGAAARDRVELRQLVASGDARALYHMESRRAGDLLPAINYVRGRRVLVWFERGEVREGRVEGPTVGVYAEPGAPAGEAGEARDTTPTPAPPPRERP